MDVNLYSLILLAFLILYSLSWLVIKTLKEGREALKQTGKDIK